MFNSFEINNITHHFDAKTGFLRQTNPDDFVYDNNYNQKQSTTVEMSYFRLALMMSHLPADLFINPKILEIGPGKGVFLEVLRRHFDNVHGFDVVDSSYYSDVSPVFAKKENWDILIACDVIEHMRDISELFSYNFDYAYVSTPWMCPIELMSKWRHFKPNEHIWYIEPEKFHKWASSFGYSVVFSGSPEDVIRKRWDKKFPNIASFILMRK